VARYGTQDLAKTKTGRDLTMVLDRDILWLYKRLVASLAGVPVLCIVDPRPKGVRRRVAGPSACLHPDGPGSGLRFFDVAIPVAKLAKLSEFEGSAKNAKNAKIQKVLEKWASDRCPRFLQQIAENAEIPASLIAVHASVTRN
jgi:hypothetical protein